MLCKVGTTTIFWPGNASALSSCSSFSTSMYVPIEALLLFASGSKLSWSTNTTSGTSTRSAAMVV